MKKTELKDVYCVPKTEEEWQQLDSTHGFNVVGEENGFVNSNDIVVYEPEGLYQACLRLENSDIKEVSVSKFIDLLEDRIVPWRLEEVGFVCESVGNEYYLSKYNHEGNQMWDISIFIDNWIYLMGIELNIKTFTEIETLIRFLK